MRKQLLVIAVLIGVLALFGCGAGESAPSGDEAALFESITEEQTNTVETTESVESPEETPAAEPAESGTSEEASDGVWGASLMESDKDKIGTTNEYGLLYTIIYKGEFQDDSFSVYGALSYKNVPEQDTIAVTDDIQHIFKTDENTVYQMIGGEDGPEDVTREEFIENFNNCIKAGLYFEAIVTDGVCTLVTISA